VQELSAQVLQMTDILRSEINTFVKRGIIKGDRLSALKGPNGYKNQGFDLLTLLDIVRENRALIQGKTAITDEELAECEVLLDQLLTAVGEKEQLPLSSAASKETLARA
jgi:hypothetical protein